MSEKGVLAGAVRSSTMPPPTGRGIRVGSVELVRCLTSPAELLIKPTSPCAKAIVGARIRTRSVNAFFISLFFLVIVFTAGDGA